MSLARKMLEKAVRKMRENYPDYQFMTQRDIAWVLQKEIRALIEKEGYPFEVYHSYPLVRDRQAIKDYELVIVAQGVNYRELLSKEVPVELVVRLLFEPSRHRKDICEYCLPYVLSSTITNEIKELQVLKENRWIKETRLLLIDEGSRHDATSFDQLVTRSSWGDYGDVGLNVSVLEVG